MNIIHNNNNNNNNNNKILYIPGSKSITNRILYITSNIKKWTKIINPLISEDTITLIKILRNINIKIIKKEKFIITKKRKIKIKKNIINVNNSGLTIRPLLALIISKNKNKKIIIYGNKQMQNRPIKEIINIIKKIINNKNKIKYIKNNNKLPIIINNKTKTNKMGKIKNKQSHIKIKNIISSQFITAIIIIFSIYKNKNIYIYLYNIPSFMYIILTINIIKKFNTKITNINNYIHIKKNTKMTKTNHKTKYLTEGDNSSMVYLYNKIIGTKSQMIIINIFVKSNQCDTYTLNIYKKIGFKYKLYKKIYLFNKIYKYKKIYSLSINCKNIPDGSISLISLITKIKQIHIIKLYNVKTWQYKESNRIKVISKEIKKNKINTLRGKNWIYIFKIKNNKNNNILIKSYNDHRIAMTFNSIQKTNIIKPNCVKKTFPLYFKTTK